MLQIEGYTVDRDMSNYSTFIEEHEILESHFHILGSMATQSLCFEEVETHHVKPFPDWFAEKKKEIRFLLPSAFTYLMSDAPIDGNFVLSGYAMQQLRSSIHGVV